MANNITVTPGVGRTVLAQEITIDSALGLAQVFKLALGDTNAFDRFLKAGQQVLANSISVVLASDQPAATLRTVGSVTTVNVSDGDLVTISQTPTVSATPDYSIGDTVGTLLTLANAVRASGGYSRLESVAVYDLANVKPVIDILFFDSSPGAATITDNSAFVFSTDISKFIGKVSIGAADYSSADSKAFAHLGSIGKILKASGSTSLYAVAIAQATINLATTADLKFEFSFKQG